MAEQQMFHKIKGCYLATIISCLPKVKDFYKKAKKEGHTSKEVNEEKRRELLRKCLKYCSDLE
jgi:hypothetical protein